MTNEQLTYLLNSLIRKTKEGNAHWQKTSRQNQIQLIMKTSTVLIDKWKGKEGSVHELAILNIDGETVLQVREDQNYILSQGFMNDEESFSFPFESTLISKLYNTVSASFTDLDSTINQLIDEIDNSDQIGDNGSNFGGPLDMPLA